MNLRMQIYTTKEIATDCESVSRALNKGCKRDKVHYKISGVCQVNETVFFPMEKILDNDKFSYILAPFSGHSKDLIQADIFTRWTSGFRTKGLIELSESFLGLFELVENGC